METCPDCKAKDKKIEDLQISIRCGSMRELKLVGRVERMEEQGILNCFRLGGSLQKIADIWVLPVETIKEILEKYSVVVQ